MTTNILIQTWHGLMIVNRLDWRQMAEGRIGVGLQLIETGAFDRDEVQFVTTLLQAMQATRERPVIAYDIGANLGCHCLVWARELGANIRICAVEAQPRIFQMLCGNIALNNHTQITPVNAAVGGETGTIRFAEPDYAKPASFGSLELRQSGGSEFIGQALEDRPQITVPLMTLTGLSPFPPDFIKLDVEGMEEEALCNEPTLLRDHRPVLFVERIKTDQQRLVDHVTGHGYLVYVIGINFLMFPKEATWLANFIQPYISKEAASGK